MSILSICPPAAALSAIPSGSCPVNIGQIQKVAFQRVLNGSTKNSLAFSTAGVKASWTAKLTASDSTKIVASPFIQNPSVEPGGEKTYGGGNATLGGVTIIVGRDPSKFSAELLSVSQATVKAMKAYMSENVGVYLINEFGQIIGLADDVTTPTKIFPIPIKALFVSDLNVGGFEAPDKNKVSWQFLPNWSDNLVVISPSDFDALVDLNV